MKFWADMNSIEKRHELKTQLYNYKVKLDDDAIDYLVCIIDAYLKRSVDIPDDCIPF